MRRRRGLPRLDLGFTSVNLTIDAGTGLVAASQDPAGVVTDFEYDTMGRMQWEKPEKDGTVTYSGYDARGHAGGKDVSWSRGRSVDRIRA